MAFKFTEFKIEGLHSTKTITVTLRDNKIVLVGVNGLGKTTVINLLYYTLSKQWDRLLEYDFDAITFTVNGTKHELRRKKVESGKGDRRKLKRALETVLPPSAINALLAERPNILHRMSLYKRIDPALWKLAEQFGIPPETIIEALKIAGSTTKTFDEKDLKDVELAVTNALENCQIVYLPTYRRIERDLKVVFPGLEDRIEHLSRRRMMEARFGRGFIELVEFGMQDVQDIFEYTKHQLNSTSRLEITNLAGGYLRDVVRGEGKAYDAAMFRDLGDETMSKILNRVGEMLNSVDKRRLTESIKALAGTPAESNNQDGPYVAHFFSKLIDVHNNLVKQEQPATTFANVCNHYLVGKYVQFDSQTYEIRIRLDNGTEIQLRDLSSGEKQIVSLFSHIYLQKNEAFALLIDEPELSLSVAWQKLLLPDIWNCGRCVFLAAVTHSPFVFDNVLEDHAADLAGCITEESPK